jgi:hypothetical protein
MRTLDQIERWMQSVIVHPGGAREGVASPAAQQIIGIAPDNVETVVTRSRALTGLERLEIYNRAYFARLLECLREEFPGFLHAVGEEAFAEFAVDYLHKYPSTSYTLNDLGTRFPRYLAETRPGDEGKKKKGAGWPDFLVDLATLELTYSQVFDGPGVEGQPLFDVARLQAVTPETWPEARLVPVPCLRLLHLRFPVHKFLTAVRQRKETVFPRPRTTFLAVTRRDHVIRRYALSRVQYVLLGGLAVGQAVGQAIREAAAVAAWDPDQLAARLREWFHNWTAEGFFQEVELPRKEFPG